MFSEGQILLGIVTSFATIAAILGLLCFVGWILLRNTKI